MYSNNLMKNAVCSVAILSLGFPFFSLENLTHSQMYQFPVHNNSLVTSTAPLVASSSAITENSTITIPLTPDTSENNSTSNPLPVPIKQKKRYRFAVSIASNYVYIREKPTTKSKILGKLYKGNIAKLLKEDNTWSMVKSNSVKGFVKKEFVKTSKKIDKLSQKNATKNIVVQAKKLNVRNKKSRVSEIVTQIAEGSRYQVVHEDNEWVKIKVNNNETGYVSKEFVDVQKTLKNAISIHEKKIRESSEVANRATKRFEIVNYAKQFIGNPYVYGGTSLTDGIDCSAFTQAVLRKFGVNIPRTSREQAGIGEKIDIREVAAGDLIFYSNGERINHVVLCIGNGKVISASNPRHGIRICNINYRTPVCARRVLT